MATAARSKNSVAGNGILDCAEARFYDANNRIWLAMDPIKDGGNWYQYCYGDPLNYFDPNGLEVYAIGYELAEAMGIRVGAGTQFIFDDNGNVGILEYRFVGGGFPVAGFGGLAISKYWADEIWDLNGMGGSIGGSANFTILGVPVSIGADYIFGVARDGSMVSGVAVSFSGEATFPLELHGTWVISTVYEINFLELAQNVQELYRAVKGLFQRLSCD